MRLILVAGPGGVKVIKQLLSNTRVIIIGIIDASKSANNQMLISLESFAKNDKIKTWPASVIKNHRLINIISKYEIDLLLSVRSDIIIPYNVLSKPKYGCYNLHLGPLPKYAGRNAISWAIYNGEIEYGVTLHKMTKEVDAGGVVSQSRFELTNTDNGASLTSKCMSKGYILIVELINYLLKNNLPVIKYQDKKELKYYYSHEKPNLKIVWANSAYQISRLVRACDFLPYKSPWGLPFFIHKRKCIYVSKVQICNESNTESPGTVIGNIEKNIIVSTGDRNILLTRIIVDGASMFPLNFLKIGTAL